MNWDKQNHLVIIYELNMCHEPIKLFGPSATVFWGSLGFDALPEGIVPRQLPRSGPKDDLPRV